MEIAVFEANPGDMALTNFNDTVGLRITLSRGNWVVFGRAVILNYDGEDQAANAQLRSLDGSNIMDRVDVRVPSLGDGCAETLPLQGVLTVEKVDIVDITCATYKGRARQFSLIAMKVDVLARGEG